MKGCHNTPGNFANGTLHVNGNPVASGLHRDAGESGHACMESAAAGRSRWRLTLPWRRPKAGASTSEPSSGDIAARALEGQTRGARRVLALAVLLFLSTLVCAAVSYERAARQDDRHEAEQRAALAAAIESFRTAFAELTASRANELSAVGAAGAELAARLAPTGSAALGHDQAYVVGADRSLVTAYPTSRAAPPAEVARVIDRYLQDKPNRILSDLVLLDDAPALVAVSGLRGGGEAAGTGQAFAATRHLDAGVLRELAQVVGIDGLAIERGPVAEGRAVHSLVGEGGRMVGWLSWERDRPMTGALRQLAPAVALIAVGLLGFARIAVRQMRRSAKDLAESEASIWRLANQDPLTGLPNHRQMLEVLERALAARAGTQVVTFAYLDLDGFKEINEALGHQGGDQLLTAVADRLRTALPAHAVSGRFGGDEFVLVMTSEHHEDGLASARSVLEALNKPYWLGSRVVEIGASLGLAQAPRDARQRDDLTHRADLALREAKRQGRGLMVVFDPAMDSQIEEERFFKRELQKALNEDMMDVHYQPIVTADGSRIVGVEALLRWTHPTRGEIRPSTFIPIAEQNGLMDELGAYVLKRALGDARRWPDLYIAVNLSPVQVRDKNLIDRVSATLKRTAIEPARVVLEITEGVLMENPEEAKRRLEELRALGVRIALDDFGSGYSSFAYLQRFPFDKLKIDQGFVHSLSSSANGGVIIQAIVALGRALGVTILVEGIETEEQRVLLRLAGCDEMQGYLFARPAPREGIDRLWADANLQRAGARHPVRAIG